MMNMQHTKKYIVYLLAAIMLVSGCGCGKEGKGKNPVGNVAELEEKEKNLLVDCKTAYMSFMRLKRPDLPDSHHSCTFHRDYTILQCNSFAAQWNDVKTFLGKSEDKTGYILLKNLRKSTLEKISTLKDVLAILNSTTALTDVDQAMKTCVEKNLELYRNRLAMIDCTLEIQPAESKL